MCDKTGAVLVDCDAGRRMGCATFCCRLLVRLRPHEMEPSQPGKPAKGYVDKDRDGLCTHINRDNWQCSVWENRPETCRDYNCNEDFKLQIVLREGYRGIVELARRSTNAYIPRECYLQVPQTASSE